MKLEFICPRCHSPQRFALQRKTLEDGQVEVFIKCRLCRWYKLILVENADMLYLRNDIEKLKKRAVNDPALSNVLRRRIKRLRKK